MRSPLVLLAAVAACLLTVGLASAQIERDASSRVRGDSAGLTRDVFSRANAGREVEAAAEPAAEFQLSPYLEIAANAVSFSIKGAAQGVTQIVSVTTPPVMEDESQLLADLAPAVEESSAETEPELASAPTAAADLLPVAEETASEEAAMAAAAALTAEVAGTAGALEAPEAAESVSLLDAPQERASLNADQEEPEPAEATALEEIAPDAEPAPDSEAVPDAEPAAVSTPLRPSRFGFDEFPETGGTAHDPGEDEPGPAESAQPPAAPELPGPPEPEPLLDEEPAAEAAPLEEQVDEPDFFSDDKPAASDSLEAEAELQEAEAPAALDAGGKQPLAFNDGTTAFALPDHGAASTQLATGSLDEEVQASLQRPDWGSIIVPSSVTELARGNHRRRQVALTFDDGPHPEYTEQLLSILDYYDVKATFFFVGTQCVKYPQWVQFAHSQGHEIGSHAYDHFRLPNLPKDEKEYQIDEYQLLVKRLIGTAPRFMRPPGGQIDDQTRELLRQRGLIVAMWDVALNDTRDGQTAEDMLKTAKKRIRPGSVILAHDGVKATVELLPLLIEELRRQGYEFVTMSEMAAGL